MLCFFNHLLGVDDELCPEYLGVSSLELHSYLVRLSTVHLHPELLLRLQLEHLFHSLHLKGRELEAEGK